MNVEGLQAAPHHGLRYVESDHRRVVLGPGFHLTFAWLADRWSHDLALGESEVARAVESDSTRDNPARVVSPTYQEIGEHPFSEGVRLLLTGQSTPHHFSSVVTIRREGSEVSVEFDVADRCREPVDVLAATYLVPMDSSRLMDAGPDRIAWTVGPEVPGGSCLELIAIHPARLSLAEAGRRASRVQVLAAIDPALRTHRLAYRWRWSPLVTTPGSTGGVA